MKAVGFLFLSVGTWGVYNAALMLRHLMVPPVMTGIGVVAASFGGGVFVVLGMLALSARQKET